MSRRLMISLAIGAALSLAATAWHVNGAWNSRTHDVRALRSSEANLARERVSLNAAHRRLRVDQKESDRARATRDRAQRSVEDRGAQLAATEVDREAAGKVRADQNSTIVTVRLCLAGARTALDALQRRDTAATVAALQSVDAPCRAAESSGSGPAAVYGFDFPDPFVLTLGTERYAFATNSGGGNIQVLKRQADGAWATNGDALGRFPDWAGWGRTWAPSVLARPGGFVMYYTVRESATGRQCVSRAVAIAPTGPYLDASTGPLECGERGAIDPEAVIDANGNPVLLWKHEHPNTIVARQLTADGLNFVGEPHQLLTVTAAWEANNIEAPSMLVAPDGAWLFFSANDWNSRRYATGVVHCSGPLGPCDRASAAPLFATHGNVVGPGGGSVFQEAPGQFRLAYHAYRSPNVGYPASRLLYTATIDLSSGRPVLVE